MLEALLLSLSCTLVSNTVEYKDSAYHSVKEIRCPLNSMNVALPYNAPTTSEVRLASLTIIQEFDHILIKNEIIVDRPWIAPIPLFMEIAKKKHNDKLAEELDKLTIKE